MKYSFKHNIMVIISVILATLVLLAFLWIDGLKDRSDLGHNPVNSPVSLESTKQPHSNENIEPNFLDIINLPYEERDKYLTSFSSQYSITNTTNSINEYKVSTLRNIFDPKAPLFNSQFQSREQNNYDEKIIIPEYQAPVYSKGTDLKGYQYLEHYMVFRFKSLLSVKLGQNNKETFDSIAIYIFNNEVQIALYQGDKYTHGYKIQESYFKNLIIESESFIKRLNVVSCSHSPDC